MQRELINGSLFMFRFLFFFSLTHFCSSSCFSVLPSGCSSFSSFGHLSSAAVHIVGTMASLAATTVSATESPPGVVESDDGEAAAAELLGAARLLVVMAASSSN